MYTGTGILNTKPLIVPYKKLTIKDFEKFMRSITRHNHRDILGRFTKKPKVVLHGI